MELLPLNHIAVGDLTNSIQCCTMLNSPSCMSEELFHVLELTHGLDRRVTGNSMNLFSLFLANHPSVVLKIRNPCDVDTMFI